MKETSDRPAEKPEGVENPGISPTAKQEVSEKKLGKAGEDVVTTFPRLPWHFYLADWIFRVILWRAERIRYRNFHWAIVWDLLLDCNLDCIYCTRLSDFQDEKQQSPGRGDPGKMLEEIIRFRPKYLLITGGEPTLLENLPEYLRRIKEEAGNPYVTLNTHLVRPMEIYEPLLPYLDGMHVSIDGLGEVNRKTRGTDGDWMVERLCEIRKRTRELERPFDITSVTVVTLHNYAELEPYIVKVRSLCKDVHLVFTAMQPFDHPLSITAHPELLAGFLKDLQELRERYGGISIDIPIIDTEHKPKGEPAPQARPYVNCLRQYFRTEFSVLGENLYCRPGRFIREFKYWAARAREARTSRGMWQIAFRAFRSLLFPRHGTRCYFPCKCDLAIEAILRASNEEDPALNLPLFRGRFSDKEIADATRFAQRYNSSFRKSFLKRFRKNDP